MLKLCFCGINNLDDFVEIRDENINILGGHKMLKAFMKSKKGFTLVELMVVVVIIGILTAIAIPVYNGTQKTAKDNACAANERMIKGAIEQAVVDGTKREDIDAIGDLAGYFEATPACPYGTAYAITDGVLTMHAH